MFKSYAVIIITILFLMSSNSVSAQTGNIFGKVIDEKTKQPLIGANILIMGSVVGASTGINGEYRISNIPVDIYRLKVSYIGYQTKVKTDVVVKSNRTVFVNVQVQPEAIEGEEVVVTSGYFERLEDSPISSQSLNNEEVRRSPGSREDVSRMIQNLPGVNPTSDDRNDLVIRGGSPVEVQFLMDNIEVPNPNHFGTQGATGGPIGMINTEFIDKVNFYSGGFTSGYGNKLSGVMEINLREGNKQKFGGKLDLNFGGAGAYLEGPFASGKGSYLISAHRSFLDLFKGLLDYGGVPIYSNTQGKINYNLSPNHELSFLWLGGDDKINIDYDQDLDDFEVNKIDTNYYQNVEFKARQLTVGSNLKSIWSNSFHTILTASHSYSTYMNDVFEVDVKGLHTNKSKKLLEKEEIANRLSFSNSSVEQISQLKFDANMILGRTLMLSSGVYAKRNNFDHDINYIPPHPNKVDQYGQLPNQWNINVAFNSAYKYGGYLNIKKNLFNFLTINAGGRIDHFDIINSTSFSPRFTLLMDVTNNLTLHSGYGIYYQNPEFIWITSHKNNRNELKDLRSDHFIAGLNYLINPDLKLSFEVYYKKYHNYTVANEDGYEMISMANSGAAYGIDLYTQKLTSKGEGFAKGLDFMLQQKMTKSIYGLLSYSYSKTEHKALDGISRPGGFDSRNVINLILGYKLDKGNEISLKFKYAGGRPYTPFDRNMSKEAGDGILDLTNINSERYEDYQRLDLRYDRREFYDWGTIIWYASVENILNKKNVLNHYWNRAQSKTNFNHQTALFFVGGCSLEF